MREYFELYASYLETPIKQLMQKYNIYNKSIISIGAGRGYEEYWFAKENKVTLLDNQSLPLFDNEEPILDYVTSLMPPKSEDDELRYIIEDAVKYKENEKYDVVYLSNFPPDEYYKKLQANVIRQFIPPVFSSLFRKMNIFTYWKRTWVPFHSSVRYIMSHYLKENGLFILQSYYAEVPGNFPEYTEALKDFFKGNGMHLVRLYYYAFEPYKHLIIAFKGSKKELTDYVESIKNNKDITTFFGRHQVIRYLGDKYTFPPYYGNYDYMYDTR
jgi:hypothetical protein